MKLYFPGSDLNQSYQAVLSLFKTERQRLKVIRSYIEKYYTLGAFPLGS